MTMEIMTRPVPYSALRQTVVTIYNIYSGVDWKAEIDIDTYAWMAGHLWDAILDDQVRMIPSTIDPLTVFYRMVK